ARRLDRRLVACHRRARQVRERPRDQAQSPIRAPCDERDQARDLEDGRLRARKPSAPRRVLHDRNGVGDGGRTAHLSEGDSMRLENKVALITGAGSGMGREAAVLFARDGGRVVVVDVIDDAGEATVAAVREAGGDAMFVRADVSSWDDCQAMVRHATDGYGGLHVIYNNAGIFPADDGGVLDTPEPTWERVMNINLKGAWLGCKAG